MRSKFLGMLCVVAASAAITLGQGADEASARGGLFGLGLFAGGDCSGGGGLQSYSGCSGGGLQSYSGCSGGGLQSYATTYVDCTGGGGGGMQSTFYQPSYVMPSYAPSYYQQSGGCGPNGCPPAAGNSLTYSRPIYQSAPQIQYVRILPPASPVPVVRGETYVAGSYRELPRRTSHAKAVASSAPKARRGLPPGYVLHQLTQEGCEACLDDQKLAAEKGIPLDIVKVDGDEPQIDYAKRLWKGGSQDFVSYPAYVLTRNGQTIATGAKRLNRENPTSVLALAWDYFDGVEQLPRMVQNDVVLPEAPSFVEAASIPIDKQDLILQSLEELIKVSKDTNETLKASIRTAAK